ncbi:tol-pal system-associated acyl-CoA thioesterase [Bacilli bacterium]|nr:tol-pal system-associated acyl-CoA thioesterase [Bacilli bacterium]
MLFQIEKRVCFCDTDAGGVVYHSKYLDFCEEARLEFMLSLGISQTTLKNDYGLMFVVKNCHINYIHSAKLENLLRVTVENAELKAPLMKISHLIYNGENTPIAQCELDLVVVNSQGKLLRRLPEEFLLKFNKYAHI